MKTKKLRFLALLLSVLLMASMLPPSALADEPADELSQETIDRVYDEVLSGEITSTEDVLRVALAQYEIYHSNTINSRSAESNVGIGDELPRITQTIDTFQDEEGYTILLIADTIILARDSDGTDMTTDRLVNYGYANFENLYLSLQHAVYYYYKFKPDSLDYTENAVKMYKQTTRLYNYNGVANVSNIVHEYYIPYYDIVPQVEYDQVFTSPTTNTTYTTYPKSTEYLVAYGDCSGFGSRVVINRDLPTEEEYYLTVNMSTARHGLPW